MLVKATFSSSLPKNDIYLMKEFKQPYLCPLAINAFCNNVIAPSSAAKRMRLYQSPFVYGVMYIAVQGL
jgi:hypothetical protein